MDYLDRETDGMQILSIFFDKNRHRALDSEIYIDSPQKISAIGKVNVQKRGVNKD